MSGFFSCFTGNHYICVAWVHPGSYFFAPKAEDKVRAGLRQLAGSLRMHVLRSQVDTLRAETGQTAYIGFVSLMESHIAMHTWPEDRVVQLDVYSCVRIPHAPILKWLQEAGAHKGMVHDVSGAHSLEGLDGLCVERWEK